MGPHSRGDRWPEADRKHPSWGGGWGTRCGENTGSVGVQGDTLGDKRERLLIWLTKVLSCAFEEQFDI